MYVKLRQELQKEVLRFIILPLSPPWIPLQTILQLLLQEDMHDRSLHRIIIFMCFDSRLWHMSPTAAMDDS